MEVESRVSLPACESSPYFEIVFIFYQELYDALCSERGLLLLCIMLAKVWVEFDQFCGNTL